MSQSGPDAGPAPQPPGAEPSLLERLRHCVEQRREDGQGLAVLLVDCGVIGRIDSVWGHPAGDAVRSRVLASLRAEVLRPEDFAAALGRDELACVLSAVEEPQIALLAAEKLLRTLNAPLWLGEAEVYASPSVGIAVFPATAQDAESLLRQARIACTAAARTSGRIAIYDEGQDTGARLLAEEGRLRSAVAEDALEMVFQPQFDLRFGQIMGVEAMLRWRDGGRGLVPMREAFAAAAAGGSVGRMISSLLNRALRNCSEFRQRAGLDLRVAINLPLPGLLEPELAELVERSLHTWALRAGRLVFEIEDLGALHADADARAALGRLRKVGVKLSVDDTRAPLASLLWISSLPFQELKIDLGGVGDLAGSESVLRSLIESLHQLRLDVVATGVSDEAAATQLRELGCDFMQADFRGPPVDPEAFVGLAANA